MNTPASAVVPSREAVAEWEIILEGKGLSVPADMLRTLLAEVERLTCLPCSKVLEERNELRTTVAQLERTVAEQDARHDSYVTIVDNLVIERDALRVEGDRINSIADLDSVESFLKQSDDDKRKWFATAIVLRDETHNGLRGLLADAENKVADQAAALAERDKDAERMDWIEKYEENELYCEYVEDEENGGFIWRASLPLSEWGEEPKCRRGNTAREAIDAALAASVSSASEEDGDVQQI